MGCYFDRNGGSGKGPLKHIPPKHSACIWLLVSVLKKSVLAFDPCITDIFWCSIDLDPLLFILVTTLKVNHTYPRAWKHLPPAAGRPMGIDR